MGKVTIKDALRDAAEYFNGKGEVTASDIHNYIEWNGFPVRFKALVKFLESSEEFERRELSDDEKRVNRRQGLRHTFVYRSNPALHASEHHNIEPEGESQSMTSGYRDSWDDWYDGEGKPARVVKIAKDSERRAKSKRPFVRRKRRKRRKKKEAPPVGRLTEGEKRLLSKIRGEDEC